MGGWDEEVWYSMYQLGLVRLKLARSWTDVRTALLAAAEYCPERAEPLLALAVCSREFGSYADAYRFAVRASAIAEPADALFVESDVYRWKALDERALAACYVGLFDEALTLFERLLNGSVLPGAERQRVLANHAYCFECLEQGSRSSHNGEARK
jgi:tetratricopeptide (TPR) repeat protein